MPHCLHPHAGAEPPRGMAERQKGSRIMQLSALIVDFNPMSRSFLWQVTVEGVYFRRVKAYSHTQDALEHLRSGVKYDVLLITSQIPQEETKSFIQKAKESEGGKEAAYIVVVKMPDQTTENVASGMLGGTDGFLFEPFSVESLKQVATIAERVRKKFEDERQRAAYRLIATDVMRSLDEFAVATITNENIPGARKQMQQSVRSIKKMTSEQYGMYVDIMSSVFETARPRAPLGYKGASQRVRDKARKISAKRTVDEESAE